MKSAPSALVSVGGFGIAVATTSVLATAAIVILAPRPVAARLTPSAAIDALRMTTPGFERGTDDQPPAGERAPMVEALIAEQIHHAQDDVRVNWQGGAGRPRVASVVPNGRVVFRRAAGDRRLPAFRLVPRPTGGFDMLAPGLPNEARASLLHLPLPAFAASVRQRDGRWLTVQPVRPLLARWQRTILLALAVSLIMLAPLAWLFAQRLTRPFRALSEALNNGTSCLPDGGPRELREASQAIAAMRVTLTAEAEERARILTAVAHDLRTPLTGLRLRLESAPEPQRTRMIADVERMGAMIGEVLSFARDAAVPDEVIDLRPLLAAIVADYRSTGARIDLMAGDAVRVSASEPALRRAIENLVRNAVLYAGGGTITLRSTAIDVAIAVTDTGPGIPAADRDRLIRPFERGETSRNRDTGGIGLGLSIVRDFAARHHGSLTLTDAPGGGTTATLTLPAR